MIAGRSPAASRRSGARVRRPASTARCSTARRGSGDRRAGDGQTGPAPQAKARCRALDDQRKTLGPGAAWIAVGGLERHRQARVLHRVRRGEQAHGPTAVLVGVERAGRDAPAGPDEPQLVEAVRTRVAQPLDVQLDLAPDRRHADRGGDVDRFADRALQPLRRRAERQHEQRRGHRDGGQRQPRPAASPRGAWQHASPARAAPRTAAPIRVSAIVHRRQRAQLVGRPSDPVGELSHRSHAPAARRASRATRRTRAS